MFANLSPSVLGGEKQNPQKRTFYNTSSLKVVRKAFNTEVQSRETASAPPTNESSNHLDPRPVCLQENAHCDFIFVYLKIQVNWLDLTLKNW